jgi:hypothetical protein
MAFLGITSQMGPALCLAMLAKLAGPRTEQLRKLGNFIDYYLDEFNQIGVFICHKHIVAKQRCSRNRGERALSSKLISCLGIVQLPRSGVEHMP